MQGLSIHARSLLLSVQQLDCDGDAPAPTHRLLAVHHARCLEGRGTEAEALEALAADVRSNSGLEEPEAALRLLVALADSASTPITSRAVSEACRRLRLDTTGTLPPPPNQFYPSALVPCRALTDASAQAQPALRVCSHSEELRRAISTGTWTAGDAAVWDRLRSPLARPS